MIEVPSGFKWQGVGERDAFEKLARIAGVRAATQLMEKNPHIAPSKLLAKVSMASLPAQRKSSTYERKSSAHVKHKTGSGASVGSSSRRNQPGVSEVLSEQEVLEQCAKYKETGNSHFKRGQWALAANAYAQGATLGVRTLPADYDSLSTKAAQKAAELMHQGCVETQFIISTASSSSS